MSIFLSADCEPGRELLVSTNTLALSDGAASGTTAPASASQLYCCLFVQGVVTRCPLEFREVYPKVLEVAIVRESGSVTRPGMLSLPTKKVSLFSLRFAPNPVLLHTLPLFELRNVKV